MTLFWIIAAAMIVAALALLAPTLLRSHAAREDASERFNIEIARERLADLTRQKDAGELSDEEYNQARNELELALAVDLEGTARPAPQAQSGGRWALLAAALLVPAITITIYLQIGSPNLIEARPAAPPPVASHAGNAEMPSLDVLVKRLRDRMEAEPGNVEGWFLLGRTYMRLQNYPDSVYAFEKVVELQPNDPAGLVSLADALTMRDGRNIGQRATGLLQRALEIDPNNITALWLLGIGAADHGDNAKALALWQRAYPLLDGQPRMQTELGQMITQAGGTPPSSTAQLPPIMAPATAAVSGAGTGAPGSESGGASVVVDVALAPALLANVSPDDTVFVLARAESGPPMPLAVARHRVSELPLKVTLTDAMAMMPAMRLSAFPRVKVSAKVSKSGQAGTQPGDLLADDVVVEPATTKDAVSLLIDHVAPGSGAVTGQAAAALPAVGGASVGVQVALAPELLDKAAPDDTVFVLARAESGPPMPLAVARHRVSELPLEVTLTDAMAMMPTMRLSAFPRVKVSAKVSKSGQAGTRPGDLLADDVVVEPAKADGGVQLLINRVAQ